MAGTSQESLGVQFRELLEMNPHELTIWADKQWINIDVLTAAQAALINSKSRNLRSELATSLHFSEVAFRLLQLYAMRERESNVSGRLF